MLSAMTHNLAMTVHKGKWFAIGGRHNSYDDAVDKGSALLRFKSKYVPPTVAPGWWRSTFELIREEQPNWPDPSKPSFFQRLRRTEPEHSAKDSLSRVLGENGLVARGVHLVLRREIEPQLAHLEGAALGRKLVRVKLCRVQAT